MRRLIPVEGEVVEYPSPIGMNQIRKLIGADTMDSFNLFDRRYVVLVDDAGHAKNLPVNIRATAMYWERCGGPNSHTIRGPVFLCPDSDFEEKNE